MGALRRVPRPMSGDAETLPNVFQIQAIRPPVRCETNA
jgi:hypothetical protein